MAVIVVLGCTGAGKSKLGIEIAEKIGGEVVSADSIQVYSCLDISSAKVTAEECNRVVHHMLDVASPTEKFDVVRFRETALPIIQDIQHRGKIPVIVGGTNYYIEALLWDTLMPPAAAAASTASDRRESDDEDSCSSLFHTSPPPMSPSTSSSNSYEPCVPVSSAKCCQQDVLEVDKTSPAQTSSSVDAEPAQDHRICNSGCTQADNNTVAACGSFAPVSDSSSSSHELYEQLLKVDPEMAKRLHPNNKRKIQRSLEVFKQHGVPHSQLVAQQRAAVGESSSSQGGPLRFPSACVLWIQCDLEVLDKRLHRRVDEMLRQGLMQELEDFHRAHGRAEPDFTHGVFQSIGYKEFFPYLSRSAAMASAAAADLQSQCTLSLKRSTCRYARKQISWVKNRFLKDRASANMLRVYGLDSSDASKWQDCVLSPAVSVVQAVLAGETPAQAPLALLPAEEETWSRHTCALCEGRVIHGDHEWKVHLGSRSHRRRRKRRQQEEHRTSFEEP